MERPFVALTFEQFRSLLARFPFQRRINAVHMHHTWRPSHVHYNGIGTIQGMFHVHTTQRGFSDIAQHITIAPDGTIWTGRNWDKAPASATGHNGSSAVGPFMFEMIGDFDKGQDPFRDPQSTTAFAVVTAVQRHFGLSVETLHFHREMAPKSCPGTGIDYQGVLDEVRKLHATTPDASPSADGSPFSSSFSQDEGTIRRALQALQFESGSRSAGVTGEELGEKEEGGSFSGTDSYAARSAGSKALTTADFLELRPHVINLRSGLLVEGGKYSTLPADVERIFGENLRNAIENPASAGMPARPAGDPFRVMLWAHGGLIGEEEGLRIALKHLRFWKTNGVYPIYFVWETGLYDAIGHLLGVHQPVARNLFSDRISDPILERLARSLGGEKVWGAMKWNAEACSTPPHGGALKAAAELAKVCAERKGEIELYAAGHSAGSIFHSSFLPAAQAAGVPAIRSLFLLAPAVRMDFFRERLLKLIGNYVEQCTLFTMFREAELNDNCAKVYRKSLLYLIRYALEPERKAEILGLEESLRRDAEVAEAFGLGGVAAGKAEVIFSPSTVSDGVSATESHSHGGFDDDAATMNAIALRILRGKSRSDLALAYVTDQSRDISYDLWKSKELQEVEEEAAAAVLAATPPDTRTGTGVSSKASAASSAPFVRAAGQRRALCVGIDRYPSNPLAGCVRDAKTWSSTLQALGFDETSLLLDQDATYANIKSKVKDLIVSSKPGDVIVWQYSGHGTQVPDVSKDEGDGQDEAICPYDFNTGHLLVDDEIGEWINSLPAGVNFTLFLDCCHSGTLNRFGVGEPSPAAFTDARPRFVPLTAEVREAYLRFARSVPARLAGTGRSRSREAAVQTNEVLFSACKPEEVAWESNGQGEFTLRATRLLAAGQAGVTNDHFHKSVIDAFGSTGRQTPTLSCADRLKGNTLLASLLPVTGSTATQPVTAPGDATHDKRIAQIAVSLEQAARELRTF